MFQTPPAFSQFYSKQWRHYRHPTGRKNQNHCRGRGQARIVFILFAASGLRAGELFGLEVRHFIGNTLTVEQSVWEVHVPPPGTQYNPGPFEIGATNTNKAFVTTAENAVAGGGGVLYELDLGSFQVSQRKDLPFTLEISEDFLVASSDGSSVAVAVPDSSGGPMYVWHSATDSWDFRLLEGQFWNGLAISGSGNVIIPSSAPLLSNFPFPYVMDSALNVSAQVNYPDFESPQNGPPLQIDQNGALLYAMTPLGVYITDVRHDQVRESILLNEQLLPFVIQPMAITPTGDQIFLITKTGLTVVQLDAVPLSIGSVSPAAGGSGTPIILHGTGFLSNTAATIGGVSASSSLIDSSVLQIDVPSSLSKGAYQIVLTNSNGTSYSLDAGFTVR